jgi:hypothetical protein
MFQELFSITVGAEPYSSFNQGLQVAFHLCFSNLALNQDENQSKYLDQLLLGLEYSSSLG